MARWGGPWRYALTWWVGVACVTGLLALIGWALSGKDGLHVRHST
ncbi:hypothetical protein [Herbidospora mongoliensis]|nr:hypothetical protein [Herbidospora mongoliensis]